MADNYIKAELGRIFKTIAKWKGLVIKAWHIGDDHIHSVVDIPLKYSVSCVISIIKGKSSAWIKKKTKKLPKGCFWAKGYFVSTVGVDEMIIQYCITMNIEKQGQENNFAFIDGQNLYMGTDSDKSS